MSIESELTDFLAKQTSGSQTANRDIEVVMHHYGFRDKFRPTYEETAHFTGLESKQRAEQIVRKFFKSVVKPSDLLELRRFRDILIEKRYWKIAELQSICLRAQLLGNNTRIQSLLILMDEIGLRRDYETYTTEMNRLSSAVDTQPTDIIIQESVLPTIKNIYNIVRNAPGQNGVANLTTVLAGTNDEQKYEQLMKDLITNSHDTWFSADRNEFWYVFESYGKNRVRNYSGKLFSVVDSCEIESMVEAYHNDLQSRRRGVASNG